MHLACQPATVKTHDVAPEIVVGDVEPTSPMTLSRPKNLFTCRSATAWPVHASMVHMRNFDSLSEREILALAISLEEEDERVYADFAEGLRKDFPGTAAIFDGMRTEESGHRRRLTDLYRGKFGDHIPLIRRQDVRGFVNRRPIWLARPLGLDGVRRQAGAL